MSPGHACVARGATQPLMIWAMTELAVKPGRGAPRVLGL